MPRIKNFKINASSKYLQVAKRKAQRGGYRLWIFIVYMIDKVDICVN